MKYLISTTTHNAATGAMIDNWEGDYTEAKSKEEAVRDAAQWEAFMIESDGAEAVEIQGNKVFYQKDGEEYYSEIHADATLYTAAKESGDFIEEVGTISEGLALIAQYEEQDKQEGIYTEGFYDIVNELHESVI